MIDLENKEERNKLIDDFFNKNLDCDIKEVYQAVVNTVADLEYENEEKTKEIERLNNIINELENFMKMQQELYRGVLSKRPENDSEYNTQYATMVGNEQLSIILDKLQELKGEDKE